MSWLMENSALILIIGAVVSFAITAFIEFMYYRDLFGANLGAETSIALSVLLALFFQGIRCASLASTAKMFSMGKQARGFFVLFVSLSVTVFCAYEAGQVAQIWERGNEMLAGHIKLIILCLVWSGWVLELILIVNVSAARPAAQAAARGGSSNGQMGGNRVHVDDDQDFFARA